MSNFQPVEVLDRGSETQPQVVENLNKFKRVKNIIFLNTIYSMKNVTMP